MKTKEKIMMNHCSDNGLLSMQLGKSILAAMEEYAAQTITDTIPFAVWLSGHDEETIKQMYDDFKRYQK